jgi:tRNA(fMet)-specific endonuclease VapC
MILRYLLHTNTCAYIRQKRPQKVLEHFENLGAGQLGMSLITYGELMYGALKRSSPDQAVAELHQLARLIPVLGLPSEAAPVYGAVRAGLARAGETIRPNDIWIAAHALAADLVLVTNNDHAFKRIRGLKVENWAK